jgi:hypothetical protein
MGSKEPVPWSPRWVTEKLREANNGLPPNDPNLDKKPPADAEIPLCKCELDCQSHMSLEHETYGMRYWSCQLPSSPFNWGWEKKKLQKPPGCDALLWLDNYMTPKDKEWVTWIKKNKAAMSKGASSSK